MAKRRKRGTGSIHLRNDGRWEGRCLIGYDEKGLPKTKNVLAKTKSECIEKLKVLQQGIHDGPPHCFRVLRAGGLCPDDTVSRSVPRRKSFAGVKNRFHGQLPAVVIGDVESLFHVVALMNFVHGDYLH